MNCHTCKDKIRCLVNGTICGAKMYRLESILINWISTCIFFLIIIKIIISIFYVTKD